MHVGSDRSCMQAHLDRALRFSIRRPHLHLRQFSTLGTSLSPLRELVYSKTHFGHDQLPRPTCQASYGDPESLHSWLIRSGCVSDRFLTNCLINGYAKVGSLDFALNMFDEMPDKNNVSWTCLISGYSRLGFSRRACELFACMISSGFVPTHYTFGSVLQACHDVGPGLLNLGVQVHCMACKLGYNFDHSVCNAMVLMYGSCSYDPVSDALKFFHDMPKDDVVSWNAMISVSSKKGDIISICELFSAMQKTASSSRLKPDGYSFGSVITAASACLLSSQGSLGLDVLVQIIPGVLKYGFLSNLYVGSALVSACARAGLLDKAINIFVEMPNRNVVSLNGLMVGFVKQKCGEKAVEIFKEASALVEVNDVCYAILLSACSEFTVPEEGMRKGREIHAVVIRNNLNNNSVAIGNCLLNLYAKCRFVSEAYSVFKLMKVKDQVSWNSLITGFDQNGYFEEALFKFSEMRRCGVVPSNFTIISSLSSCANLGSLKAGLQVHSDAIKLGFIMDVSVCNSVLTMYAECGGIRECWKIFNHMPRYDLVTWNCMLGATAALKASISEVAAIYQFMVQKGWHPNGVTFINIFSALSQVSALELGAQFHALVLKYGYTEDRSVENALLSFYAKSGEMDTCEIIFCNMSDRRDDVSWNSMLSGYVQNELFAQAIKCILSMMRSGKKIDCFTISTVLTACASIAALERGMEIHAFGIKSFMGSDVVVNSSLVDMYSKCGRVDYAFSVFRLMPSKNMFSWNSMISGCARNGYAMDALYLFENLQEKGYWPDQITYVGVLSACSHAGLVEKGLDYFESMQKKDGLTPQMEHYSCVVDLLGRAGKLKEMENFIKDMPMNPNTLVWRTVLGACCRIRSDHSINLGKQASKQLLELEPHNPVNNVLLCHLYVSRGRWEDVAKSSISMQGMPNRKEAGCSWVTLKDGLHVFVCGDKSHPDTDIIYAELHLLNKRIRDAGYVPRTDFALYDLEEENKEEILSYHSEKLAVAFVLTRPSKLPIRIMKNLRVCGDCHLAFGYISKVIQRQIILRDSNRFHHFNGGKCSCGDYW